MLKDYITTEVKNGITQHTLLIDVRERGLEVLGVKLLDVTARYELEDGELISCGTYVHWDDSAFTEDDAEEKAQELYEDGGMLRDELVSLLQEAGASDDAANDVDFSESGMQDAGGAHFDSATLDDEILALMK